ncbi:odorant receptor 85c-like [Anastrepha obliqua]|uniref:odorant receptor 85c-like n=1 Tax=Anastrepha obliqua TaxID=95512 RepID=UPI002409CDB7|nr:odorant receptor 85c-like [Anastrepha obliqua]
MIAKLFGTTAAPFKIFLRVPTFFYRSAGIDLWNTQDTFIQRGLFYFSAGNILFFIVQEMIFVLKFAKDFVQATMIVCYAGYILIGLIKLCYVWSKKSDVSHLLTLMDNIFPHTEEQQKTMNMRRYLRRSSLVMNSFSLIFMVALCTYNLYPWVERQIYDCWLHLRTVEKVLPYEIYVPWDLSNHWSFYLIWLLQSVAAYHATAGHIASDMLICAVGTQIIMHYDYVAKRMTEYQPQWGACHRQKMNEAVSSRRLNMKDQSNMERDAYNEDMIFLCDTITYHANILSLSDILNEVLGVPMLVNFIASSSIICFVGFQMTMDTGLDYKIKLTMFLFSSLLDIYLICHYGQLLIDASVNIAQATFNHDWTNAHINYQRILVLMVARAQKPAMLKATNLVSVSRGTMTVIIQISYKFFTLIRTMYSN